MHIDVSLDQEQNSSRDTDTPKIMALAGGSCSGKTTLVSYLQHHLGCATVLQDNYYRNEGGAKPGQQPNFDHPDSIDFDLFAQHLALIKQGQSIDSPVYDFVTHSRTANTTCIMPTPLILVEGILVLHSPQLRELFDFSVFTECDEITRKTRRLARDVRERGRTEYSVLQQFEMQVAPMHGAFVEPSKTHANVVFNQEECTAELQGKQRRLLDICSQLIGVTPNQHSHLAS